MSNHHKTISFYNTLPHPCSYREDKQAVTQFVDPQFDAIDCPIISELSRMGFRRSGQYIYRPQCEACNACIPVRVDVNSFKRKRNQQRIWIRNRDLSTEFNPQINDERYFSLYKKYIDERHQDGDMYPATAEQYHSFLLTDWPFTEYIEFSLAGVPVAVSVIDRLDDGLSSVYTFFDPDLAKRSLGVYAILWQIELCRQRELPYLYLGYWVKDSRKMSYKTQYRPIEMLINNRWITLD